MATEKSLIERIARAASSIIGRRRAQGPAASAAGGGVERRLSDRRRRSRFELRIPSDDEALFVLLPPNDTPARVRDLSVHGFCLDVAGLEVALPGVGDDLATSVLVGTERYPVRLRVVYRHQERMGCQLLEESSGWTEEVSQILDPMRLGQRLREIDPRYMRADADAPCVRWFQGGPACDLFIWCDQDGAPQRVQLFFMWQLVEWSRGHGLRSGETSSPPEEGARHAASDLYNLQSPPAGEALAFARRLLGAADVPEEIRALFF